MRGILKTYIDECAGTVREAIERYANTFPSEKTVGLAAVKRSDRGEYVESVPLFMKSIEYRRALERKNCGLATLSTRVVTSGGI